MSGIHFFDTNIYRFGDTYKIIYLKRFQADDYTTKREFENKNEKTENGKYINNIARAKSRILALALCNQWNFFCTFTLDKEKYNRYDLDRWRIDFTQWIRDQRKATGYEYKYLLIPEHHKKDKAWHMHGLMTGYPWDSLERFVPGKHPAKLVRNGFRYHRGIHDKFGFNSFGRIKNQEKVARYITKYIHKDMAVTNIDLGNHLFYASLGLNSPELVASGITPWIMTECDFHNDFLHTGWLDQSDFNYIRGRLL